MSLRKPGSTVVPERLRVLYLAPDCPYPAHDGGSVMALSTIRTLAGRGHNVSLSFTTMRPVTREQLEPLRELCEEVCPYHIGRLRQIVKVLLHPLEPIRASRRIDRVMQEDIDAALQAGRYDVVIVGHQTMAVYLRPSHLARAKCIVRFQSMSFKAFARTAAHSSFGLEKLLNATQAIASKRFERRILTTGSYHDLWFLVDADAQDAARLAPGIEQCVTIIPSCAEDKSGGDGAGKAMDGIADSAKVILFLGSMLNPSNQDGARWLARDVLPRVRQRFPEAMLVIVGRAAGTSLFDIAGPHVRVVGNAPDLRPYLRRCDVYAVAERGEDRVHASGIHMKLIDGLSAAKVVVASPVGTEGVAALVAGTHFIPARNADEFVDALTNVIEHPVRYQAVAEQGYRYFLRHLSCDAVGDVICARLLTLVGSGAGKAQ